MPNGLLLRLAPSTRLEYPKAVQCLTKDTEALLAFYDFPAEHWIHLRTSNPIESIFSMLRHRTIKVKGAFSRESALAMPYQLGLEAEKSFQPYHRSRTYRRGHLWRCLR
ncbi:transposase [Ferrimicrobium sp.]|uniref:transposase n=1 Tax=Ferrimicrobium sp. TaxID=2926050 RepID=UPI00260244D5|nr:transposase [Ferrimicrobium sp.]